MRKKVYNFIIKVCLYGLVLLMPLFWLPWTNEVFEFNKQYLLVFLAALAFLAWLAKMILVRKKIVFQRTPLDIFILAFMTVMILAAVFSVDKLISWLGFYGRFTDSVIGLLAMTIMYFLLVNNLKNKEKILKLFLSASALVIATTYLSVFNIWSKISWLPDVMKTNFFNPVSGSLEGLSMFLAVVISLVVGLLLSGQTKQSSNLKTTLSVFLLTASLILLLIIDFWPAWLCLGATMLFLLGIAFWTRMFRERVNLLLLPIVLLIISATAGLADFEKILVEDSAGVEQLPQEIILDFKTASVVTWQTIKTRPVLGSGQGTFLIDFLKYKPLDFNQTQIWNVRFDKAPEQFLEMFSASGILGVLSYLVLIVMFLLFVLMAVRRIKNTNVILNSSEANEESRENPALSLDRPNELFQDKSVLPLLLAWFALLFSQFVYLGNTVLLFFFWVFTALTVIQLQKSGLITSKKIVFSFKKMPEIGLIMSVVLLIVVFVLTALFYLGARFYLAELRFREVFIDRTDLVSRLEKIVQLNSSRENYRRTLSQAYLGAAWDEAGKTSEEQKLQSLQAYVQGAVEQARVATVLSPNLVFDWENLGLIYRDIQGIVSGSAPFVLEAFNKAIELEPNNPFFYREICRLNLITEGKDLDETLRYCQKAIDLKENYLDAQIQLALVYERKGELEKALKQMENVLERLKGISFQRGSALAGAATEIYFQLGRFHFNLGHLVDATKMFEQSVIITPDYANARYGLAISYQAQGKLEEALTQLAEVNRLVPGNETVINQIQQISGQLGTTAK